LTSFPGAARGTGPGDPNLSSGAGKDTAQDQGEPDKKKSMQCGKQATGFRNKRKRIGQEASKEESSKKTFLH